MNKQDLAAMVAEILSSMEQPPMVKAGEYHPTAPQPEARDTHYHDGAFVPAVTALDLRKLYLTENPANKEKFRQMKERTPARLGSGKAGPRYKTLTMLRFRAPARRGCSLWGGTGCPLLPSLPMLWTALQALRRV